MTALAAFALPFVFYLATASAHGYWLDAGEFSAQARTFGIAHPPGHPLAGLIHSLFSWLVPIGSVDFRIALCASLCAAGASLGLYRSATLTFRALGLPLAYARWFGVASAWLAALSIGWWLQAIRPEVYALQALLISWAIERLMTFESGPEEDPRPLYAAGFLLGLGLANHHLLAFLMLPASAASVSRAVRGKGPKVLLHGALSVLLGLGVYAYLPLRASGAGLALGSPDSASRMWWVISAEAFQKNQGQGVPQPLAERFADVLLRLAESVHPVGVFVALLGAYLLVRYPPTRRFGAIWSLIALTFLAARAWLGFSRDNPDALGYLMPAIAALSVLAIGAAAGAARLLSKKPRLRAFVAFVALTLAILQPLRAEQAAAMARFDDTDILDDVLLRELPANAIVLAHFPQTVFRLWHGRYVEQVRADVTIVPMPFLTYPGMADRLAEETPELRSFLRDALLRETLSVAELESVAAHRPLYIELDPRVDGEVREILAPEGVFHRVFSGGTTSADREHGQEAEAATYARLLRAVKGARRSPGDDAFEPETARFLVWHLYQRALYWAELGEREHSLTAVQEALRIAPDDVLLRTLAEVLSRGEGPIDVEPFQPSVE